MAHDKLRVLDLFAGIGGFSLGLERTGGFETAAFCEIEPYPQKVLAKHWPGVPIYDDVRQLTADRLAGDGIGVDVITGGFPCQDISVAGKQAGIAEGTRSGLWSEVARLIGELRPRYAIMENVTALISGDRGRWFGRVLGDLAEIGYDAEWHCIPASELGAHHHRDRVWIIACPNSDRLQERKNDCCNCAEAQSGKFARNPNYRVHAPRNAPDPRRGEREARRLHIRVGRQYKSLPGHGRFQRPTEPPICGAADGFPGRLDRLKCLGNAVVPQIPELIGRAILDAERRERAEDQLVEIVTGIN